MTTDPLPTCSSDDHQHTQRSNVRLNEVQCERVTAMLKALADFERLRLVLLLQNANEVCVSELVEMTGEKMSTVSNRLKQLHEAGLVNKRRDAQHIYYSLQDEHVQHLLDNLLAHAKHL